MIEPWVDIQADVDAINQGSGFVDLASARVWVHGRLWGYHADTGLGTLWPIEGDGFIPLDQRQYRALTIVAGYNGLTDDAERQLAYMEILTDEDRDLVRRIWRMREAAQTS
ncbi:MAG: hypothetical protein QM753_15685 [Thermomicrobiales bacterium]